MILRKLMTILLSIGIALPVFSQQVLQRKPVYSGIIKGIVIDSSSAIKLKDAILMVLNSKDSIIRKFTRAKQDGSFLINGLEAGNYLLYVSYPGYAAYAEKFNLDTDHMSKDFSLIPMILKSSLLKEERMDQLIKKHLCITYQ